MSFEFYASVIESILSNSQMSETATITYRNGESKVTKTLTGLFSSGTYSDDAPSSNAPKRSVRGDFFQVSRTQLSSLGITNPQVKLKKANLVLGDKKYLVLEVRGAENELLTFTLKPIADSTEEEC